LPPKLGTDVFKYTTIASLFSRTPQLLNFSFFASEFRLWFDFPQIDSWVAGQGVSRGCYSKGSGCCDGHPPSCASSHTSLPATTPSAASPRSSGTSSSPASSGTSCAPSRRPRAPTTAHCFHGRSSVRAGRVSQRLPRPAAQPHPPPPQGSLGRSKTGLGRRLMKSPFFLKLPLELCLSLKRSLEVLVNSKTLLSSMPAWCGEGRVEPPLIRGPQTVPLLHRTLPLPVSGTPLVATILNRLATTYILEDPGVQVTYTQGPPDDGGFPVPQGSTAPPVLVGLAKSLPLPLPPSSILGGTALRTVSFTVPHSHCGEPCEKKAAVGAS